LVELLWWNRYLTILASGRLLAKR